MHFSLQEHANTLLFRGAGLSSGPCIHTLSMCSSLSSTPAFCGVNFCPFVCFVNRFEPEAQNVKVSHLGWRQGAATGWGSDRLRQLSLTKLFASYETEHRSPQTKGKCKVGEHVPLSGVLLFWKNRDILQNRDISLHK